MVIGIKGVLLEWYAHRDAHREEKRRSAKREAARERTKRGWRANATEMDVEGSRIADGERMN